MYAVPDRVLHGRAERADCAVQKGIITSEKKHLIRVLSRPQGSAGAISRRNARIIPIPTVGINAANSAMRYSASHYPSCPGSKYLHGLGWVVVVAVVVGVGNGPSEQRLFFCVYFSLNEQRADRLNERLNA